MSSDPSGNDRFWFTVEGIYPDRALVLRASIDLRTGRPYDLSGGRPSAYSDSTWALVLHEMQGSRTRLVARTRVDAAPAWRAAPMNLVVGLPSHMVMQLQQFRNLKLRVERETGTVPATAAVAA
jgi:hypothetical protein